MIKDLLQSIEGDCADTLSQNSPESLRELQDSNLLVTGGTGFTGIWLAFFIAHLNQKYRLNIRVNLLSRQKNLNPLLKALAAEDNNIKFIQKDILSGIEIPKETNFVIHAAGNPSHSYHASKPIETMTTIVEGSLNVLRSLETLSHLKKVVNISSGFLYNLRKADQPLSEAAETGMDSANPSSYIRSKKFAEYIFDQYHAQFKYPICHARPFVFIGPFQPIENPWAHMSFLRDIKENRNIRILGDGKSIRSYLYGSDLAFVLLSGLVAFEPGNIYNIGHPMGISLRNLAEAMVSASGKKISINSGLLPYNDSSSYFVPDTTKLTEHLKFMPLPLEISIKKTVTWFTRIKKLS